MKVLNKSFSINGEKKQLLLINYCQLSIYVANTRFRHRLVNQNL